MNRKHISEMDVYKVECINMMNRYRGLPNELRNYAIEKHVLIQMTKLALMESEALSLHTTNPNYNKAVQELVGKVTCLHDLWEDLRERLIEKFGPTYFYLLTQESSASYDFGENQELGNIWLNAKKFMRSTIRGITEINTIAKKRMLQLKEQIHEY